jgi:prepilin-type processing-associated H-X9-DG protein
LTTGLTIAQTGQWTLKSRSAIEWMDYATPLRVEMYGANVLPKANSPDPEASRKSMFLSATDEPFYCPSNALLAPPFPGTSGYPVIRATSYLSMWTLMRGGPSVYQRARQMFPNVNPGHIGQSSSWEMAVPRDYVPRSTRLKRASLKVFLADGLRFFNEPSTIDYSVNPAAAKGMMSAEPPSTYTPDNPTWSREYVMAKQHSYRHGKNDRINAGFFDGHVELLFASTKHNDRPFRGPAVHPKLYYPSRTVVRDSSRLHVDIAPGTVLP